MVIVLTGAGLVALIAGLMAVVAGFPILEFSYGNTLIMAGAIAASSGLVVIALAQILRELRRQASSGLAADAVDRDVPQPSPRISGASRAEPLSPPRVASAAAAQEESWRETSPARPDVRRARIDASHTADAPAGEHASRRPTAPSPRNLMFRKPADLRTASITEDAPLDSAREGAAHEMPPVSSSQRVEGLWKRRRKSSGSADDSFPGLDLKQKVLETSAVTVLKSGTVDGLAYTLYSDGSIEAQLEEGVVRFDSIEALRAHLDRPA